MNGHLHLVASASMRGDEGIEVKSRMVGTWLLVPTLPLTGGVALGHFLHMSSPVFFEVSNSAFPFCFSLAEGFLWYLGSSLS